MLTVPLLVLSPAAEALGLLVAGLLCLTIGQQSLRRYTRLLRHGRRTRGVIMAARYEGEAREVHLRFLTYAGLEVNDWLYTASYVPGDRLVIWYDPAQPRRYRIGDGLPLGFFGLTILGGWLVAIALWQLVF